jgi:hypothetical protein
MQAIGVWLSLVEHLVRDEGVVGSNPITPTNPISALKGHSNLHAQATPAQAPRLEGTGAAECWSMGWNGAKLQVIFT